MAEHEKAAGGPASGCFASCRCECLPLPTRYGSSVTGPTRLVTSSSLAPPSPPHIAPGQTVEPHTSRSTVMLAILAGGGIVTGSDGERAVHAGDVVAYEPNEIHGMACSSSRLRFASRAEVDVRMGLTERSVGLTLQRQERARTVRAR